MNYVFITLSLITFVLVLSRKFDFLSFGAITFIFYTINCAFGQTWISGGKTGFYYNSQISQATYLIVIMQLLIILLYLCKEVKGIRFTIGKSYSQLDNTYTEEVSVKSYKQFWSALLLFCYIVILYNVIFNIGVANFFSYARKSALVENVSGLFSFGIWGSIICFLHAVKCSNKRHQILSFFLILVTVLMGSRAYLVTIVVGTIAIKSGNLKNTLRENIKIITLGGALVVFLLIFKNIYSSLRALDFSALKTALSEGIIWTSAADIAEFRTVFSIYDYVVSSGFRLPMIDSIARFVSFVPFINSFFSTTYPIRLSSVMKETLRSSYGVGGNYWAETYAMGGLFLLLIVTVLWLAFLRKSSNYMGNKSDSSVFVITIASYCSFYIHRLDWVQVFGCVKSVFVFYILFYLWKNIFCMRGKIR